MADTAKAQRIGVWVLSGLLALLFLVAGGMKLLGTQESVDGFQQFGYPQWFRLLIGVLEVAGAVGLLASSLAPYSAGMLAVIMIGAVRTHIRVERPVAFPLIVGVLLVVIAWFRWRRRD